MLTKDSIAIGIESRDTVNEVHIMKKTDGTDETLKGIGIWWAHDNKCDSMSKNDTRYETRMRLDSQVSLLERFKIALERDTAHEVLSICTAVLVIDSHTSILISRAILRTRCTS